MAFEFVMKSDEKHSFLSFFDLEWDDFSPFRSISPLFLVANGAPLRPVTDFALPV